MTEAQLKRAAENWLAQRAIERLLQAKMIPSVHISVEFQTKLGPSKEDAEIDTRQLALHASTVGRFQESCWAFLESELASLKEEAEKL